MIRLYRYLYLLAAVYFSKIKCNRAVIGRADFAPDAPDYCVLIDSDTKDHCYTIFYGTNFNSVKKWQYEEKINAQSVLLLQCSLIDCAELPSNFFTIGCRCD